VATSSISTIAAEPLPIEIVRAEVSFDHGGRRFMLAGHER
jgi:hypothetical protein